MIGRLIWMILSLVISTDAVAGTPREMSGAQQGELRDRYAKLMRPLDGTNGIALYAAQQLGTPLVIAGFKRGDEQTRVSMLRSTVAVIENLPKLGDVEQASLLNSVARFMESHGPVLASIGRSIVTPDQRFDGLAVPNEGPALRRHIFPMRVGGTLKMDNGNAQQFAYLLSTVLRLAVSAPSPQTGLAAWNRDLVTLHAFLTDDTLRFYWLEAPAWHWTGAFPNMRARTVARLNGVPQFAPRKFFSAFIDYDLHVLAIAADLKAVHRLRPNLVRNAGDRQLVDDAFAMGMRVLKARVDRGPNGDGFAFDRGAWDDNPSEDYAGCMSESRPSQPCRRKGTVQDVSHAQRWPLWLASFIAATAGTPDQALLAGWCKRLAHQFVRSVVRYDSAMRPRLSNFIDGHDGWYLYSRTVDSETGYPPGSLTGWSMRHGNWALLAPFEPEIGKAYERFCAVATSERREDIAFRSRYYGGPGDPLTGFRSTRDEFGQGSAYAYICRLYVAQGLIAEKR